MTEKRDVVRRLRLGRSIREISRETGMHRTLIRDLKTVAEEKGWLNSETELPTEDDIKKALGRSNAAATRSAHPLGRFKERIEGWLQLHYSYVVIHHLIKEEYPCSEATVRRYCHETFPHLGKRPVMVRITIPGEVMEVDFGYLGIVYDHTIGRNRRVYLFSARLRHSRYAYREKVYRMDQVTFYLCHIHAFEFFGGVPEKVTPDNLKAAVVKASFEDILANRVYQQLAMHYGFLISPCLPYTPRHKGGVESDIKYVKRNFWPLYVEQERQLGHEVPHGEALREALDRWSAETAHVRTVKGLGRRPVDMFAEEERAALKPLPACRWDRVRWGTAKVQETWRIQFDSAFYSVPFRYIGKTVTVMATSSEVVIYDDVEEIARHTRAPRPWAYVRNTHHAPPHPEEYMQQTRERLLELASRLGPELVEVARAIFSRKPVDGMRPVRALLSLRKRYPLTRVREACKRAIQYDCPEYLMVKRILITNIDLGNPALVGLFPEDDVPYRFAREQGYFVPEAAPWTN